MSTIIHRIPLNDGTTIPWLGFGTGGALIKTEVASVLHTALACGVAHFDSAQLYDNEASLGAALAAAGTPRDAVYVTTKLAKLPRGKSVRDTLVASLAKLRLDHVDLFLIHAPIFHKGRLAAVWKEFEAVQREGLARSIGVSNFTVADFEELLEGATVVPAINEVCASSSGWHPG